MLDKIVEILKPNQLDRRYFFNRVGEAFPQFSDGYKLVDTAYEIAKDAHREQARISGERYFEHPRAVALMMLEYLRIRSPQAIAAGLIHDVPEDCPSRWPIERVEGRLGTSVANRVEWGNKRRFDHISSKEERKRRYTMSLLMDAPREVAEWKLPDGLNNLMSLWDASEEKIQEKIDDALAWRLPLAEKHGILVHEYEEAIECLRNGIHILPPPEIPMIIVTP